MYISAMDFAHAIGFVAMVVMIVAYAMKSDRRLNQIFVFSNILWFVHFILIGATSGGLNAAVNVLRSAAAVTLTNKKHRLPLFFVMSALYGLGTWYGYKAPADNVALAGSIFTCIAFYLVRPGFESRYYILLSCFAWTVYAMAVHSISGMIAFSVSSAVTASVLFRLWRVEKSGHSVKIT